MMYNTRYLPENFDQCRLEKTILRQFPYNLSVRSSWNALIQDGGKYHERLMQYHHCRHSHTSNLQRHDVSQNPIKYVRLKVYHTKTRYKFTYQLGGSYFGGGGGAFFPSFEDLSRSLRLLSAIFYIF